MLNSFGVGSRRGAEYAAPLLATGQTTKYVDTDDGDLEKGIVKAYSILTTGQYSGTTAITVNGKTDNHANACVLDTNTGLMWSRYASATLGPNNNGTLPWTTNANGEGIFTYVAAANAASLAGYSDWRVPNIYELLSLCDYEATTAYPNSTAFPSWPNSVFGTTTNPNAPSSTLYLFYANGTVVSAAKTNTQSCALVRGG